MFKGKKELTALKMAIQSMGKAVRPQLIDGARAGMRDSIKRLRNEGKEVTVDAIMSEVVAVGELVEVLKEVDITVEDLRDIASDVLEKYQAEPVRTEDIGRNAPCPCGSGLKYKRCCLGKQSEN